MTWIIILQPTCKGRGAAELKGQAAVPSGGVPRWASAYTITLTLPSALDVFQENSSVISEIHGFWRSLASQEDVVLLRNPRPKDQVGGSNSDRPQMFWGPGLQT